MCNTVSYDCSREETISRDERLLRPGWLLLTGRSDGTSHQRPPNLLVEYDAGQLRIPLAAMRNGEIAELVKLPAGMLRLALTPADGDGGGPGIELCIRRCPPGTVLWLLTKRILHTFFKLSAAERQRAGLKLPLILFSPLLAYRLCSRFLYHAPAPEYATWLERFDTLNQQDRRSIVEQSRRLQRQAPPWQVIIDARQETDVERLKQSLACLHQQLYTHYRCLLLIEPQQKPLLASHVPDWIQLVEDDTLHQHLEEGGWSLALYPGCYLAPHALYWFVYEALHCREAQLIYSDHDRIDDQGRRSSPQFKPDWSPELAVASGYPGCVLAVRNLLIVQAEASLGTLDSYSLLLGAAAELDGNAVQHIPAVLWHQDASLSAKSLSTGATKYYLEKRRLLAEVQQEGAWLRLRYQLPAPPPMVSIIIPTRDQPGMLRNCVESVLGKTTYSNYEVIIVDNQSCEPETLAYFAALKSEPRVRLLCYDRPFNYAAINNYAVQKARGSLMCLLNNDTEVLDPEWLSEMVARIAQADVGVVGAKLLYADGSVQHAGDVVGVSGVAAHLHAHLARDAAGYMGRAQLPQELSAVTAACLLTWRELYLSLGGLDERHLAVAYNDVDYCLRIREQGKRIVFTPYARLYHHESVSRAGEASRSKQARTRREERYFRRRWKSVLARDPFYNPNLSRVRADFSLSHAPLVKRPW